ncbi:hypothetical protein BDB00DRAFT_815357 [Zychaea mexicana]|uniref:uncharacterized protein n=1 Tax=Zychaea mexicana TaxID=64656 RepID=UPI0022FE9CE1|nr:uncharacterized protein BDB00DRAFT_815357 [Zychaea mexicana]KAI9495260.1 hypothetical protein BDB00DRAFT_815357 [Zychaea mexicana]
MTVAINSAQATQQQCDFPEAQNVIYAEIDRISPELRELSADLHAHPEVGMQEHHAHDILTNYLEKNGFELTRHAFDLETAFMATYTKGLGLRVGFCSEYDALPGLGHACGHNIIAISGVANAMAMKALLDKGLASGTVVLFGCPSEEPLDGKILMAKKGAFQDHADVCSMLHPGPMNMTYWAGTAIQDVKVEFLGKPAHAGGAPWNGVNALDAICQAWVSIGLLRQQLLATDRIHGIITDGGKAPNIIPDRTAGYFYVRAKTTNRVEELMEKVENCFKAAALATGCEVNMKWREAGMCKNVIQNPVMAETYARYYREFGSKGKPIESRQAQEANQMGGSTDFGNVAHLMPGLHPFYDIYTDEFPHTEGFAKHTGTEEAHEGTMIASKSLAMVSAHMFLEKGFYEKAYQEFDITVPKEQRC